MTDHAKEAARLAKKVATTDPGAAAITHALLAVAEQGINWHKIEEFEDLPEQLDVPIIFEYEDGSEYSWTRILIAPHRYEMFRATNDRFGIEDPNDLVEKCVRWRYA